MPSDEDKANELLAKIRKEPSNKSCANCNNTSRLGFGAVCTKYNTFVCDLCKSAHQSFSHRTKSVSMSVWKVEEVWPLHSSKSGGNDVARSTWFAKMTEAERAKWVPVEGSQDLEKFKKLIHAVYEEGRWKGEPGAAIPLTREESSTTPPPTTTSSPAKIARPAPGKKADEADDDLFADFVKPSKPAERSLTEPPLIKPSSEPILDLFDTNSKGVLKSASSAPVDLLSLDFSNLTPSSTPPPLPISFQSATPPIPAGAVRSTPPIDPFADLFSSSSSAPPNNNGTKKPDPFAGLF